jgi:hypothetical protein
LKSSWLKSLGLKGLGLKLGVEKSGVEMSFNEICFTKKVSNFSKINYGFTKHEKMNKKICMTLR